MPTGVRNPVNKDQLLLTRKLYKVEIYKTIEERIYEFIVQTWEEEEEFRAADIDEIFGKELLKYSNSKNIRATINTNINNLKNKRKLQKGGSRGAYKLL